MIKCVTAGGKAPAILRNQEYIWQLDKVAQDSRPAMAAVKTKLQDGLKKKKKKTLQWSKLHLLTLFPVTHEPSYRLD